jgi:hypothetical protein
MRTEDLTRRPPSARLDGADSNSVDDQDLGTRQRQQAISVKLPPPLLRHGQVLVGERRCRSTGSRDPHVTRWSKRPMGNALSTMCVKRMCSQVSAGKATNLSNCAPSLPAPRAPPDTCLGPSTCYERLCAMYSETLKRRPKQPRQDRMAFVIARVLQNVHDPRAFSDVARQLWIRRKISAPRLSTLGGVHWCYPLKMYAFQTATSNAHQ